MKEVKRILDDGQEIIYNYPENWKEVNTGQYKALRCDYEGDDAHFLEIMTGIPRASWMEQSPTYVEDILATFAWIGEKQIAFDTLEMPDQLTINNNDITIPRDLGLETFGQKMLIDNKVKAFMAEYTKKQSEGRDLSKYIVITLIDYIAAVYLCKWIMGKEKFDAGDVPTAVMHVNNTPAYLIYPIAGFFLRKSIASTGIGKQLSRAEKRRIQKTIKSVKRPGPKG